MASDITVEATEESRGGNILRFLGFGVLFLVCLTVFTLVKIPQPKIHAWILGTLNQQMNPMGIQATAEEGHIEIGFGLRYEMTGSRSHRISSVPCFKGNSERTFDSKRAAARSRAKSRQEAMNSMRISKSRA